MVNALLIYRSECRGPDNRMQGLSPEIIMINSDLSYFTPYNTRLRYARHYLHQ